jgi:hypothetical protein
MMKNELLPRGFKVSHSLACREARKWVSNMIWSTRDGMIQPKCDGNSQVADEGDLFFFVALSVLLVKTELEKDRLAISPYSTKYNKLPSAK